MPIIKIDFLVCLLIIVLLKILLVTIYKLFSYTYLCQKIKNRLSKDDFYIISQTLILNTLLNKRIYGVRPILSYVKVEMF